MSNIQTERQHNWWDSQLFNWKKFEISYISVLLLLQFLAYAIVPDSPIGCSWCSRCTLFSLWIKGRKISFIFGTVQCIAMTYIAWISHAYYLRWILYMLFLNQLVHVGT